MAESEAKKALLDEEKRKSADIIDEMIEDADILYDRMRLSTCQCLKDQSAFVGMLTALQIRKASKDLCEELKAVNSKLDLLQKEES